MVTKCEGSITRAILTSDPKSVIIFNSKIIFTGKTKRRENKFFFLYRLQEPLPKPECLAKLRKHSSQQVGKVA